MNSLMHKELRETAGIVALGFAALFLVAVGCMGVGPVASFVGSYPRGQIPFIADGFLAQFGFASFGLAVALGFRQSLSEIVGDAHAFLLHRPVSRRRIYATKLAVGLLLQMTLTAAALVAYALWAATPGTHASPFEWSMTVPAWTLWLGMSGVYLGAFLSGIRPAAWIGTRLAPLAATTGLALAAVSAGPAWLSWPGLIGCNLVLAASILYVVETRDFA